MDNMIFAVISAVCCILGMVFGLVALFRNKRIDDAKSGKEDGMVLTELGYIKAGVDDLKKEYRDIRTELQPFYDKVTRVEESCKNAHKRIDKLEKYHQPN